MSTKTPPTVLKRLAGIEGALSLTQQRLRELTESLPIMLTRARGAQDAEGAYWYVARVTKHGITLASWNGRRRQWTTDPLRATGFKAHESALAAIKPITPAKGEEIKLLRMIVL